MYRELAIRLVLGHQLGKQKSKGWTPNTAGVMLMHLKLLPDLTGSIYECRAPFQKILGDFWCGRDFCNYTDKILPYLGVCFFFFSFSASTSAHPENFSVHHAWSIHHSYQVFWRGGVGGWVSLLPACLFVSGAITRTSNLRVNINGGMTPGSLSEGMAGFVTTERSWCPGWTQHLCAKGHLGASHLLLGCSTKQWFGKHCCWVEVPLLCLANLSHSRREQEWSIHFYSDFHLWRGTWEL